MLAKAIPQKGTQRGLHTIRPMPPRNHRSSRSLGGFPLETTPSQRREHERWLLDLTGRPVAAGHEAQSLRWAQEFVAARATRLHLHTDSMGNLLITQRPPRRVGRGRGRTILFTAHLDHPAFVTIGSPTRGMIDLEFRGGVHDPYFVGSRISIIDDRGREHKAQIVSLNARAKPFKRVLARLLARGAAGPAPAIPAGCIGRWDLPKPAIVRAKMVPLPGSREGRTQRVIRTHACDDLAAVVAACAALDLVSRAGTNTNVGVLLTLAEEVGFVGAIHAARSGVIPRQARLLCLENSRSFPSDSPIGAGAILRVGDRMSVFSPSLTNALSDLYAAHAKSNPRFRFQRKLMPGGACEATAFAAFGHESTCLCLPLGNYHNMVDIDSVVRRMADKTRGGKRLRGRVGPEFVALSDFHGLISMLLIAAAHLDTQPSDSRRMLTDLYRRQRAALRATAVGSRR